MKRRFKCDICENGYRREYGHVANGECFKCNGTGKLPYNPQIIGRNESREDDYETYLQEQREQELLERAERENYNYIINGFRNEEDLTPEDFGYETDAR